VTIEIILGIIGILFSGIIVSLAGFLYNRRKKIKAIYEVIFFLDDLHRFVENQNFEYLLRAFLDSDTTIVATSRSGIEYQKVKDKLAGRDIDPAIIFGEDFVELKNIAEEEGKSIAAKVRISWDTVKFNGTVGSIFLRLSEMEERFSHCESVEKTILRAIKLLYISGIYEARQFFPLKWLKIVCFKKYELEGKVFEWNKWLEGLKDKEFVKLEKDRVWAEEVYLEYIVELDVEITNLDVFRAMIDIFSEVHDALFLLGNKANDIGTVELEKAEFMKSAIEAYEEALKVRTLERFPIQYAMTQNNIGNAYVTLAEVENKAENCKSAIEAYAEAFKIFTKSEFPEFYPVVERNLKNLLDFCGGE